MNNKRLKYAYIILILLVCIPVFTPFLIQMEQGHDLFFHLMRIEGLAQGMAGGQFPVRIQPGWYQGYGYGVSVFYGDMFLYIPAILHLLGVSLQNSYKLYVVLCNIATTAIAGYSFKGIFKSERIAFFGSALYTLSIYRLLNLYIRKAVGEYTAMIFFPLLVYGFYCIVLEEKERKKGILLLAAGMTGIIQSHIISAEICVIALGIACIVCIRRVWSLKVIGAFCKSAVITIALSLGFLVPFADYMLHGSFNANVASSFKMNQDIGIHGAFLTQLFQLFYEATGSNLPKESGTTGEMPLGVGLALGMALVAWVFMEFYFRKKKTETTEWKFIRVAAGFSLLFLWMSTIYFPWEFLRKSNKLFWYMIVNIQFPWRLFTVATLFLVLLWCALIRIGMRRLPEKIWKSGGILAGVVTLLSAGYLLGDALVRGNAAYVHSVEAMNTSVASGEEYLPFATVSSELVADEIKATDTITWKGYHKDGLSIKVECENSGEEAGVLTLPILYYEGYRCSDQELLVTIGENNLVAVSIPGHYSGVVEVYFKEPAYWKAATIFSMLCYIVLLGWIFIGRCNRCPKQPDN